MSLLGRCGGGSGAMVLLYLGLELLLPGTNDAVNLGAVLDEVEGRHRLDFVFSSNVLFTRKCISPVS